MIKMGDAKMTKDFIQEELEKEIERWIKKNDTFPENWLFKIVDIKTIRDDCYTCWGSDIKIFAKRMKLVQHLATKQAMIKDEIEFLEVLHKKQFKIDLGTVTKKEQPTVFFLTEWTNQNQKVIQERLTKLKGELKT